MVKYLTKEDNFDEIIASDKILVDFYAEWCGPCRMLSPILDNIKTIDVCKVNVDEFPEIAREYGIMSIPTIIIFKNGNEIKKEIGFRNETEIDEIVNSI